MLLAVSAASVSAQTYQIRKDSVKTGEYSPTVYLVSVNAPQPPADEEALLEAAVLNQLAIDNAIRDYIETHHPGFQQDELPHFIFATKQNKFSFSLGGQVTLRASYDFDGISGAQDFIPATIAVPGTYATRQKRNYLPHISEGHRQFEKTGPCHPLFQYGLPRRRNQQLYAPYPVGLRIVQRVHVRTRRNDVLRPERRSQYDRLPGSQCL